MNKLILVDVDEVLLHWKKEFSKFLHDLEMHPTVPWTTHNMVIWLNIPRPEVDKLIYEFNTSGRFENLEEYEYSVESVTKLAEKGYRFVAISACGSDPLVTKIRRRGLEKSFGKVFDDIHCVDGSVGKRSLLESYPKTWWIDDSKENVLIGHEIGHTTLLFDQLPNKDFEHDEITRVYNWKEIYQIIDGS